jgi:putative transposase
MDTSLAVSQKLQAAAKNYITGSNNCWSLGRALQHDCNTSGGRIAMKRRKHSPTEIADKLVKADQLVAEGKLRDEVARALGVSIMTYHRWRKAQSSQTKGRAGAISGGNNNPGFTSSPAENQSIEQLRLENARLRNLFTDMVLEKIKLEDELRALKLQRRKKS